MKRLAGLCVLLVILAGVVLAFHGRLHADFWPVDSSRVGPNILASVVQWVAVFLVASFLYPPLRHWFEREFGKIHAKMDAHHNAMKKLAEDHHKAHMDKLDEMSGK